MAIVRKELKDVNSNVRSAYQKALDVVKKNNLDYGIELLKGLVSREPGFMEARDSLREAEVRKASQTGGFGKIMGLIKMNLFVFQGKAALSKKPLDAMKLAEEAIAANPNGKAGYNLLAEAAECAGALFLAIDALENYRKLSPDDEGNLKNLAEVYERAGMGVQVLQIRQIIARKHPDDLGSQAALRSAAALATMEEGRWNEQGSFQSKVKNKEEVSQLTREDRIVRDDADIKDMVVYYEKQISSGNDTIDNRRKLGELYQKANRHQDAIDCFNVAVKLLGVLDPALDKSIEKSTSLLLKEKYDKLKSQGAPAEQLTAAVNEINAYKLKRAEWRVENFPNDLQYRYELACIYWELGFVDNALEQFQLSQKNPQRRLSSIVFIGRCFHAKSQFDMAAEQFNKAIAEMPLMDKEKMEALYHLGSTLAAMGQAEQSMDCFKQIYSVNVNFKDVAKRIEAGYASQRGKAS